MGVRLQHTGSFYEVCISDNGPGIPVSHIDKVMEPFVQADGSPTRKHQGVGVGLAIARKIARGLGGELLVESPTHERIGGMV